MKSEKDSPGGTRRRVGGGVQLLFVCLCLAAAIPAHGRLAGDKVIKGVRFAGAARVASELVPLRGATLCRYWGFKVYTAAFYTAPEARSLNQILGPAPKRLVLYYNRSIDREDIIEASEHALRENPDVNLAALRGRLDRMYSWYEDVREGDRFWLDYVPGEGSALYFNGRRKGVIEGEDFARAFFGIWLSDHSLDEDYRDRLLGW